MMENQATPLPPISFWQKYRKSLWILLIFAAFATAALLGYVLFLKNPQSGPTLTSDVKMTINAPQASPVGSELSYEIVIQNLSNVKLQNLNLEIFYPRGFTFIDSTPDPAQATEGQALPQQFSFSELGPDQKYRLVIVGQLSGVVQEIKVFNAKLHYIPENFRSTFIAQAQTTTEMLSPQLSLNLVAPADLVTGQTLLYVVQVTNVAQQDFSGVVVRLTYPDKFEFLQAEPPATQEKNQWELGVLTAGSSRKIFISGKIFENPGKESFIQAEIFIRDQANNSVSAGRSFAFTKIKSSPLVLTHKLTQPTGAILPGNDLQYEVFYENVGELGLNSVSIAVVINDPRVINFSKLTGEQVQAKNNTIVYIPAQAPELRVVNPGQKGLFRFSIQVSDKLMALLIKNPQISSRIEFTSKEFGEPIIGNTLDRKIQTEPKVSTSIASLGGNRYRVDLYVSNTVNDLEEAELTAIVPLAEASFVAPSVNPIEEQPSVNYSPQAGVLSWNLGTVFAFSGSFHQARRLSFEIVLNSPSDTIKPVLLREIQVTGIDQFTREKVISNKIDSLSASAEYHGFTRAYESGTHEGSQDKIGSGFGGFRAMLQADKPAIASAKAG